MKNLSPWFSAGMCVLLVTPMLASLGGCQAKPEVICVMENPATSQRVEMFKESGLKVPADYDEKKHIENWKAEQRNRGFTVEVPS
jgi:hypothetical protein